MLKSMVPAFPLLTASSLACLTTFPFLFKRATASALPRNLQGKRGELFDTRRDTAPQQHPAPMAGGQPCPQRRPDRPAWLLEPAPAQQFSRIRAAWAMGRYW